MQSQQSFPTKWNFLSLFRTDNDPLILAKRYIVETENKKFINNQKNVLILCSK